MELDQEATLRKALCEAVRALASCEVPSLVVGGIALAYRLDGEMRMDHDIDLLIMKPDVERAMSCLSKNGFEVVQTHPSWLFKARLNGATVDVLYVLGKILDLDDEMLERSSEARLDGVPMRVIGREDLMLGQAGAASSEVPSHWFEALDLLRGTVDWHYLRRRGSVAPELMTALLHHARYLGIEVPDDAWLEAHDKIATEPF